MADIKRIDFIKAIPSILKEKPDQLYLFYGERYLCQEAADALQEQLLQEPGIVNKIDGSLEDAGQTLSRLLSFSLLPGKQIYRVSDSRIFQSKNVTEKVWKKAVKTWSNGKTDAARRHLIDVAKLGGLSGAELQDPQVFSAISKTHWKKSFAFDKPLEDLAWADNLVSGGPEDSRPAPTDLVDSYISSLEKGLPSTNILILTAETVDKRQRFFTFCKKQATTIDCTVAVGSATAAKKDQEAVVQEQIKKTLAQFGKTMQSDALKAFIDRVGCHPVAVVNEVEKLALYTAEKSITKHDVELLTCQTREDALFELTEALSEKKATATIAILQRILANSTHSLAIIATLRNFIRKLLLTRGIQLSHSPQWHNMSAQQFQNNYLASLKDVAEFKEIIKGHPFAVYKNFERAGQYSVKSLKHQLELIHEAEFRIKSIFLPDSLVMEELLISLLRTKKKL
ncbi:MAG: hypothetical protein OCC45_10925 [Desulfotalea sp.]